jgi:hypothetical protein
LTIRAKQIRSSSRRRTEEVSRVTSFGIHGSGAQIELGAGLDPGHLDVQRRGWGTVLTLLDPQSIPRDADQLVWIHLAIPTPLSFEAPALNLKLRTVRPETQPPPDAMHIWDGQRRLKAWETRDELGKALDKGSWPVNAEIKVGVGLSLKWALPIQLDTPSAAPQFTVFGARATFGRLFDVRRRRP